MKRTASVPLTTLALLALVLLGGCATEEAAGGFPGQGADASSQEELLAPFLACASPAEFMELQRRVDMPRLVEELEDWSAVRLGALGPFSNATAEVLNRKRAAFLIAATEKYGVARAEVFALFILHSSFDDDVKQVLRLLARDKRLGETLGQMGAAREELAQRGLGLSASPDRNEKPSDVGRGLSRAARDFLSSSPVSHGAAYLDLSVRRGHLPPSYQQALDEVERAEMEQHLSPGNVALGSFDALTFGIPLGFYHLAAGTSHGAYSLSQGRYEQATRELAPAALLVALYAGGKGLRQLSEARDATSATTGAAQRLPLPQLRLKALEDVAKQLEARLGGEGMRELARYIQARREAAAFVGAGGERAAAALHEARGDLARAQAWLSQAKPERVGPTPARASAGKSLGGVASLLEEAADLGREVVETKLVQVELEATGPRLSGNVAVLRQQRPSLQAPPLEARGHPLWSEYVPYWEKRLAELEQGNPVKPPLAWAGYAQLRGHFARGLAFERAMLALLRADAALPRAMRRFLRDFDKPPSTHPLIVAMVARFGGHHPPTPSVRRPHASSATAHPAPRTPLCRAALS